MNNFSYILLYSICILMKIILLRQNELYLRKITYFCSTKHWNVNDIRYWYLYTNT